MYYVMMNFHSCSYEIYEIVTLYYPGEKISVCSSPYEVPEGEKLIISSVKIENDVIYSECSMCDVCGGNVKEINKSSIEYAVEDDIKKSVKHSVKLSTYELLKNISGIEMPWGILVGIRPTKIVNKLKSDGESKEHIERILKQKYLIRDDKIRLVTEVSDNSFKFINKDRKNISVYIGIPFCPTRCEYCSFASYPITGAGDYVRKYLDSLIYEIKSTGSFIKGKFNVDTIYVGGGTPSSLDDNCFRTLLESIWENFDINSVNEFTVEAGRPDTINKNKLYDMKSYGVSRISINPQSMNEGTLKAIGRNHTPSDIVQKFELARELGFDNINMDIILGLSGETIENVRVTLDRILKLQPENITVHTMSLKRASRLKQKLIEDGKSSIECKNDINGMMDLAYSRLHGEGYKPYYMYRQKMTAGNLENVGYCKPGFECIYNIQMIEERETILALGADGVTKFVFLDENRIERFANKKDLKEYISTIRDSVGKKINLLGMLT